MEIRALRANDDRSRFHSGDEALDRLFHRFAGQNQFRHFLGVTYVAVEDQVVFGFATVAPRHLLIEELPVGERKKLPRYPIPVLGLARLAVDQTGQGRGIGAALLKYVLQLASRLADEAGCHGVVVDAKPGAVAFYAKYGFTSFEALEGQSDARPLPTQLWLPMRVIKAAAEFEH